MCLVVDRLHPDIINPIDKIPGLMRDLPAHGNPPPRRRLPPLIQLIRGQLPFGKFRGHHKVRLGFVRQQISVGKALPVDRAWAISSVTSPPAILISLTRSQRELT